MNIALLGYGRMGHIVEQIAAERGHSIVARFDSSHPFSLTPPVHIDGIDCFVDFSTPEATPGHVLTIAPLRIPIVAGTTGWHEQLPGLIDAVTGCGGTLFYAANFSVGAHILFHAVGAAAELLDRFPEYDIAIHEVHHRMKKDAPSGTARTLAGRILGSVKRKTTFVTSAQGRPIQPHELLISSSRIGTVAGTHTVMLDSPADSLRLTHVAHDRRGFALGAVQAAEWVQGRTGIYTMDDLLSSK